ncbi:DUF6088 family protein [uncultured Abiotrophia sp.]|uniref:DUF6088 family protein n=1 Tax=uncultured Abiotrophia sp. TaxID=316094 RepID=UPI00261C49BC|nr:DUF6088 family protein [uncultured Abiotrophia sp.]
MTHATFIAEVIEKMPDKEIFFAKELYDSIYKYEAITEENYYQILKRNQEKGRLVRLSKGVYAKPKNTRFGIVSPSEIEIIDHFIKNDKGMFVGYQLFNQLHLTSQVSKKYHIITNNNHNKYTINNISIKYANLEFTKPIKETIAMLEVLSEIENIQDLDEKRFMQYCEEFAINSYSDDALCTVLKESKYQKYILNFLKKILDTYEVQNTIDVYLSKLTNYKKPKVSLYEFA